MTVHFKLHLMHTEVIIDNKSSSAKGVLTMTEQNALAVQGLNFQVLTNGEVFFFTDDPSICDGILAGLNFRRVSLKCPHFLPAKRSHASKMIQTAEQYIRVFRKEEKHLTSIDELAAYLDQVTA